MKIRNKLIFYLFINLFLFANLATAVLWLHKKENNLNKLITIVQKQESAGKEIFAGISILLKRTSDYVFFEEKINDDFMQDDKDIKAKFSEWESLVKNEILMKKARTEADSEKLADIYYLKNEYENISNRSKKISSLKDAEKKKAEIISLNKKFDNEISVKIKNIIDREKSNINELAIQIDKQEHKSKRIIIILLFIALLLILIIYSLLTEFISRPLKNLEKAMSKVGQGEFETQIKIKSKDELGHLAVVFNKMIKDLKYTTTSIKKLNREITKRKSAEIELKRLNSALALSIEKANMLAQEADIANKAKTEFLANMSHEIRTLMNAIIGFSDLLSEENLTDDQLDLAFSIKEAGKNLLTIIDEILDLSKIEAGKLKVEFLQCPFNEFIDSINSFILPLAKGKNLDFKIIKLTTLPEKIKTDPTRLRQCLINLLSNAVKFTKEGYVNLKVQLDIKDSHEPIVRFDIEDTGIGIKSEHLPMIFEPFSQAEENTSKQYGGTGLGLAITKNLLDLLGGIISVKSHYQKGSVFTLKIPVGMALTLGPSKSGKSKRRIKMNEEFENKKKENIKKILVAEDNYMNQKLVKKLLNRYPIDITIAEDGKSTIDIVNKESFDLILMDMQMPKMNGYTATRKLRENGVTIPIIAMTAFAMVGDDKRCLNAGCSDYLAKPLKREQLEASLKKYKLL